MVVARSSRARAAPAHAALLLLLLAAPLVTPAPHRALRHRRQLADDDALQPLERRTGTTWPDRTQRTASTHRSAPSWSAMTSSGRRARQADDIPTFDRNKVSLDFPGNLFGPTVSLLIRTTKVIGDVIQNSAVRYQTFLRLFRPLFRGQFQIKGLDPPATTTTTTPAPAPAPPAAGEDNEVRRRRHLNY